MVRKHDSTGNYSSENGDTISERTGFEKLADKDIQLVLERVKSSEEPWWGIGHLAKSEISDSKEVRETITNRASTIAEGLEDQEKYWDVLENIEHYDWLFENEHILKFIADSIRKANFQSELERVLQHIPIIIKHDIIKDSLAYLIENSRYQDEIIEMLQDFSFFFGEVKIITAFERAIMNSDNPWWLIRRTLKYRPLAENQIIREAITSRIPDIIEGITGPDSNFMMLDALLPEPSLLHEPRIFKAIVSGINNPASAESAILFVVKVRSLTLNSEIQRSINKVLESTDDLMYLLDTICELPSIMQNPLIQTTIDSRIGDIVRYFKEDFESINYLGLIAQVPILAKNERIQATLKTIIPKIVEKLVDEGNIYGILPLYVRSSWFRYILDDERFKEAIIHRLTKNYGYEVLPLAAEYIPEILDDTRVIENCASAFQTEQYPFRAVEFIVEMPQILNKTLISDILTSQMDDIFERVRTSDYPVDEISTMYKLLFFSENPQFIELVLDIVSKYDQPWLIASAVKGDKRIIDPPEFRESLQKNLSVLADVLLDDNPRVHLDALLYAPEVLESNVIKTVLTELIPKLSKRIKKRWECWFVINDASTLPQLRNSSEIQDAIMSRVDDLAFAIRTRQDGFEIISQISWCEELVMSVKIIDAILFAIENHNEPWEICDIKSPDILFQNELIRKAILDRAADIAFFFETNRDARTIVPFVERYDFLAEQREIKSAISSLRNQGK